MSEITKTDTLRGLSHAEAEISRREHGANDIPHKKKVGFFKRFLSGFGDPIIKILLVSLAINIIFMLRDFNWYESVGIAFAVLLATLVSTLSEYGSESAFEKLQEEASHIRCRVVRGGETIELLIDDIVVGDTVLIQSGERIPADGRLVLGELSVDQSALNGESHEARKYPSADRSTDDFLCPGSLFRGSVVCSGEGAMIVESVGGSTFYGRLAVEVQEETIESPLKERLGKLAKVISIFGYVAALVVVFANLFNNILLDNGFNIARIAGYLSNRTLFLRDLSRAVTLGITVIVMAVPEGLPMMITVVLSANMRRMLKDNVLVRKMVGIETSGSMNILFSDKTGTLTEGKLSVTTFVNAGGAVMDIPELRRQKGLYSLAALNCYYNNSASCGTRDGVQTVIGGNSTDRALLSFVKDEKDGVLTGYKKGRSVLFDSRDKYSMTEIVKGGKSLYLVKGAPENLLPRCAWAYDADGSKRNFDGLSAVRSRVRALAMDSVRVLALCACDTDGDAKELKNLTLIGLLGIRDVIRAEAPQAIRDITDAGIQVVMVTGDNRETAVSIAAETGLIGKSEFKRVLTSAELNGMTDDEVKAVLPEIRVIARALPSDKSRLVRLSQEMGLVAGMTGDGVNDAPALKKADVGFAMGTGAEVAKEAGDIVILDNNIASIALAVLYGRTIFKSIRKFLVFQLTINLCAVGVSVIGPFIGVESPVTVIQMLWINIIMDTLAGLAYAGEAPLREYMKEPPKKRGERIINRYMYSQIVCTGLYTTAMCLLFFKSPLIVDLFRSDEIYRMTAFFALFIFAGVFNSLNSRTYRLNLFAYILGNKAFMIIMALVLAIQVFLIYHGGTLFRTAGLMPRELAAVVGMAASVILFDLLRKLALRIGKRKGFL